MLLIFAFMYSNSLIYWKTISFNTKLKELRIIYIYIYIYILLYKYEFLYLLYKYKYIYIKKERHLKNIFIISVIKKWLFTELLKLYSI